LASQINLSKSPKKITKPPINQTEIRKGNKNLQKTFKTYTKIHPKKDVSKLIPTGLPVRMTQNSIYTKEHLKNPKKTGVLNPFKKLLLNFKKNSNI